MTDRLQNSFAYTQSVIRLALPFLLALPLLAQSNTATTSPVHPSPQARETAAPPPQQPSEADILRGAYGPFRANNDLLYYHLDVRVDPVAKTIAGSNLVRFRMLEDGTRIQLDLTPTLSLDSVELLSGRSHKAVPFTRVDGAFFLDFPRTLRKGETAEVLVHYHGAPVATGRFGGMSFEQDPAGRPWIFTACEDDGSSIWWPSKDQWQDEPQDGMDISVAVPKGLTDVSNGKFVSEVDLYDGYTQWNWHVSYPINSYDVALNIADYAHFSDTYKNPKYPSLALNYYALPEDEAKAKVTFAQANGMLDAFEHYFGEYPFARDGYKLIQVPYAGMEHQSAVAYGNEFDNGYLHRDWTGVGISPRFDFIIIHESGHEWFGNAITAKDRCDMWIHEGWDTYLETLYVEFHYGKADALKYISGLVPKVHNRRPIISECGVSDEPPQDMYFKGALMINTLRSALAADGVADDARWFALLREFYDHFKYTTTTSEDVVAWWNHATGRDLTPFFNEYLRHAELPGLQLNFDEEHGLVMYKWQAEEPGFAPPVQVGDPTHWQTIHPTRSWQWMKTPLTRDQFQVATGLYYINVSKN